MRCQRCGGLIGSSYATVNGAYFCDNCARDMKIEDVFRKQASLFEQAFPILGELTNGIMGTPADLDFGNNKIKCPKCGTTLRELDSKGVLGCIECYNTYNETVLKNILKKQGSSEYIGRKPGVEAGIEVNEELTEEASKDIKTSDNKTEATPEFEPKAEEKVSDNGENLLDKFNDSDWSAISDSEIEAGMMAAAKAENYQLAAKLRDELKKRKEGN